MGVVESPYAKVLYYLTVWSAILYGVWWQGYRRLMGTFWDIDIIGKWYSATTTFTFDGNIPEMLFITILFTVMAAIITFGLYAFASSIVGDID